jgi:hypothetical protein
MRLGTAGLGPRYRATGVGVGTGAGPGLDTELVVGLVVRLLGALHAFCSGT